MDGWETIYLLGRPSFRGYVSFREGTSHIQHRKKNTKKPLRTSLACHTATQEQSNHNSCALPEPYPPQKPAATLSFPQFPWWKLCPFNFNPTKHINSPFSLASPVKHLQLLDFHPCLRNGRWKQPPTPKSSKMLRVVGRIPMKRVINKVAKIPSMIRSSEAPGPFSTEREW